jgi:hypothetical protein
MRVLQRSDFVIGGYTPAGRNFDSILIGDYVGRALQFVAKVYGGLTPGGAGGCLQAHPRARNENLPVQEPARGTTRSVERMTDSGGDEEVPLAETTVDCDD